MTVYVYPKRQSSLAHAQSVYCGPAKLHFRMRSGFGVAGFQGGGLVQGLPFELSGLGLTGRTWKPIFKTPLGILSSSPTVPSSVPICVPQLTLSLFSGSTSIIPRRRLWQSGGMKWGMWKTPRFTFSSSWRRLSSSKGRAPWVTNDQPLSQALQGLLAALSHSWTP